MSLPGFVEDSRNGRYYRKGVEGCPEFVKELDKEQQPSCSHHGAVLRRRPSRRECMPLAFYARQQNFMSMKNLRKSLMKSKLNSVWEPEYSTVSGRSTEHECHVVTKEGRFFYMAGHTSPEHSNSPVAGYINLDKVQFEYRPRSDDKTKPFVKELDHSIGYVESHGTKILDLCGVEDQILYISNADMRRYCLNISGLVSTSYDIPDDETIIRSRTNWCFNRALRCCAYCPHTGIAALGTESNIVILNNLHQTTKVRDFTDDINCLCFGRGEGILYYGSRDGGIYRVCLKSGRRQLIVQTDTPTSRIKALDNERNLIISGHKNKLCYVDTRLRTITMNYEGHQNDASTIPFSVDEEVKVLCSVGDDNVTRFWSLLDSTPLAVLPPPMPNLREQIFSFLHMEGHELYAHIFCSGRKFYSYRAA